MSEHSDWLEARRRHITASEIGAILGHGYAGQNAFTVWDEKVNGTRQVFNETVLDAGNALEDVAAKALERQSGLCFDDPGRDHLIEHSGIPWISCTVDRVAFYTPVLTQTWRENIIGNSMPIEIKWMGLGSHCDREEWIQDQPLRQQLQLQCQMAVLEASKGVLLGAFVPGCTIHPVEKEFDPDLFDALFPVLEKFWHHVRDRITPNPDDYSVDCKAIRRIFDTVNRKTIRIDDPEKVEMVEHWRNCVYNKNEWARMEEQAKAKVLSIMGENAFGHIEGYGKVSRKVVKRDGYTVEPSSYIKLSFKER